MSSFMREDGGDPLCLRLVLAAERFLSRGAFDAPMPVTWDGAGDWADGFDVVVNLTGDGDPARLGELRLRFDGQPGEAYLLGRLLSRRPPLIEVVDGEGCAVAASYAALETPLELGRSIDQIGRRIVALVVRALEGSQRSTETDPVPRRQATKPSCRAVIGFGAARVAAQLAGADRPLWQVAIRPVTEGLPRSGGDWCVQPTGFLADPCLHARCGVVTLFGEALDATAKRGRLVCASVSADGALGEFRTVLQAAHHLSYPFVFDHDGEVFMIPETGATHRVELYRAVDYPTRWAQEAVLIEGPKLVDATLLHRGGLWWMFAGGAEHGDSAHDQLFLYYSERLMGPWHRHALWPLKSDCRGSRPAGRLLELEGRLYRPSQNNELRYGGGLVWSEVLELTPETYREQVVTRWSGLDFGHFDGVHSFSRAGGIEAVDLLRLRPAISPP